VAEQIGPPNGEIVLRELLVIWERLGAQRTSVPREVDAIRHATLVHGLAAHAAQLSKGALALMEQNLWVPTYPLVRLILEDAILVEWLESETGSWRELLRRSAADLIRLVDQIAEHGTLTTELTRFREVAEANLSDLGGPAAGRFTVERQMTDLAGAGKALYTDYRILSQYCHAGKPVVDLYSIEDDSTPGGIASLRQPKFDLDVDERSAVHGYAAAGLLQILLAWSRCTSEAAEQAALQAIAKRLSVQSTPPRRA
jgi:hypothetical protein